MADVLNIGKTKSKAGGAEGALSALSPLRALEWMRQGWRPVATGAFLLAATLLMWHVFSGSHGVSSWIEERKQEKQLRQQIDDLQKENADLKNHIEKLKTDPKAIEHEAHEKLHYVKPGEVLVNLPNNENKQAPAAQK